MSEPTSKRSKNIKYNIQLNQEQKDAKAAILAKPYSFLIGKAGSGKTLLACQIALDLLFKKEKSRIYIARPTISTEDNGFLPGSLNEKMEPWLVPIRDNMNKVYARKEKLDKHEADGDIKLISLSHFRGITFDNAIVIVDEFQNLTLEQMIMALSRLGKDSMMIFCGDPHQIDLKHKNDSASRHIMRLKDSDYVNIIELKENHRHEAVSQVLKLLQDVQ